MPKTITATEAKSHFGSIASWVVAAHDAVMVERHGHPKVVIIAFEAYQRILEVCGIQQERELAAGSETGTDASRG